MVLFFGIIKWVDVIGGLDIELVLLMVLGRFEIRWILCFLVGFFFKLFDLVRLEVELKIVLGVDVFKIGVIYDIFVII